MECDLLGVKRKTYLSPKKDSFWSGYYYISLEAITFCSYLKIDLSSIENVNKAVSNKVANVIVRRYNEIYDLCNGDWSKMCDYMSGNDVDLEIAKNSSTGIQVSSELLEKGLITKEDFNNLKKKLLGL